jgi:hypothetical protein
VRRSVVLSGEMPYFAVLGRTRPCSAVLCGALQVGWCIIEVNGRTVPSDDAQLIKEVLKGLWY